MFEQIVLRRTDDHGSFDAGLFAETLLYYGKVQLLLDRGALSTLCTEIGFDSLMRAIDSGYVRPTYLSDMAAVYTETSGWQVHSFIQFQVSGTKERRTLDPHDDVGELLSRRHGFSKKDAAKAARRFLSKAPSVALSDGLGKDESYPSLFSAECQKAPDLLPQVQTFLRHAFPTANDIPVSRFKAHYTGSGSFMIDTDLPWPSLNTQYRQLRGASAGEFNGAHILSALFDAYIDLGLAGKYGAELVTSSASEALITQRLEWITKRRRVNVEEIAAFNRLVFPHGYAIREAINEKRRTFGEFLDVLDAAARFKAMLREANPDVGLIKAYHDAAMKGSWLDKLPPKLLRFGIFNSAGIGLDLAGAGGMGTAGALALSGLDSFLLDKMLKGWRPNTFVQKVLVPFVSEPARD